MRNKVQRLQCYNVGVCKLTPIYAGYINFGESPFILNTENKVWETQENQPRLGTISITGINGTNAHAVIEEYIPQSIENIPLQESEQPQVMVFSAKNPDRLIAVVEQMLAFIEQKPTITLADMAYTLQIGREAMEYRLAMVISSWEELRQSMKA